MKCAKMWLKNEKNHRSHKGHLSIIGRNKKLTYLTNLVTKICDLTVTLCWGSRSRTSDAESTRGKLLKNAYDKKMRLMPCKSIWSFRCFSTKIKEFVCTGVFSGYEFRHASMYAIETWCEGKGIFKQLTSGWLRIARGLWEYFEVTPSKLKGYLEVNLPSKCLTLKWPRYFTPVGAQGGFLGTQA